MSSLFVCRNDISESVLMPMLMINIVLILKKSMCIELNKRAHLSLEAIIFTLHPGDDA